VLPPLVELAADGSEQLAALSVLQAAGRAVTFLQAALFC
jgi:hypothetical protein